jgi:hypothetical protein
LPKYFRDRAFARGNAAGEADEFHAPVMAKSLEACKPKV